MSPWERLLEKPQSRGHFVQFYQRGDGQSLVRNVGLYVSEGLKRREGVLVIATAEHREGVARELDRLGIDAAPAIREQRFICLDAQETIARIMVAGQPVWDRFESEITAALRPLRRLGIGSAFRAYGEMVDLLWNARQFASAVRLEQFWNSFWRDRRLVFTARIQSTSSLSRSIRMPSEEFCVRILMFSRANATAISHPPSIGLWTMCWVRRRMVLGFS